MHAKSWIFLTVLAAVALGLGGTAKADRDDWGHGRRSREPWVSFGPAVPAYGPPREQAWRRPIRHAPRFHDRRWQADRIAPPVYRLPPPPPLVVVPPALSFGMWIPLR